MTEPVVWAARRDASWYNRPNVNHLPRMHIDGGGMLAACNRGVYLVDFTAELAATVPEHSRCRRPGCAARWPTPERNTP